MTPKVRKIKKIHQSPVCGLSPQVHTLYATSVCFPLHAFWILGLICLFFFSFLEEGKHKGALPKYPDWKQEIVFSLVP